MAGLKIHVDLPQVPRDTFRYATRINGCEERHTGLYCRLRDLRKQYRRVSKCAKRSLEPAEFIQSIREGPKSEEVRCPTAHAKCSLSGSKEAKTAEDRLEVTLGALSPGHGTV